MFGSEFAEEFSRRLELAAVRFVETTLQPRESISQFRLLPQFLICAALCTTTAA